MTPVINVNYVEPDSHTLKAGDLVVDTRLSGSIFVFQTTDHPMPYYRRATSDEVQREIVRHRSYAQSHLEQADYLENALGKK